MARTYQALKRELALLIDRDDATMQTTYDDTDMDVLDGFLGRAEMQFYRSEVARIPPLERTENYSIGISSGVASLAVPADYFESNYILVRDQAGNRQSTLARVSRERILTADLKRSNATLPVEFAYADHHWVLHAPSLPIEATAHYYGFLPALNSITSDTESHWILNNASDLILYWAAVEGGMYFRTVDPGLVQMWQGNADRIAHNIVEQARRQEVSGSTGKVLRPYRVPRRGYGRF